MILVKRFAPSRQTFNFSQIIMVQVLLNLDIVNSEIFSQGFYFHETSLQPSVITLSFTDAGKSLASVYF